MFRCGLWASSGPFPLSAHYGLYKRGRDPPTNPSRHLKKERKNLPLKWLLKEDQGRRPTAASAAAPPRAAVVPAAETAASPCLGRVSPACSLPAATAAAVGTLCHLPTSSTDPLPPPPPSTFMPISPPSPRPKPSFLPRRSLSLIPPPHCISTRPSLNWSGFPLPPLHLFRTRHAPPLPFPSISTCRLSTCCITAVHSRIPPPSFSREYQHP